MVLRLLKSISKRLGYNPHTVNIHKGCKTPQHVGCTDNRNGNFSRDILLYLPYPMEKLGSIFIYYMLMEVKSFSNSHRSRKYVHLLSTTVVELGCTENLSLPPFRIFLRIVLYSTFPISRDDENTSNENKTYSNILPNSLDI